MKAYRTLCKESNLSTRADKAYSGTDKSDPREQVKRFFLEGLRDTRVQLALLSDELPTVEAAYQKALVEDKLRIMITVPSYIELELMEDYHAR